MSGILNSAQNPHDFHDIFSETRDIFVFDLDNTLYPAESNLFAQVDMKIGEYVQNFLNLGPIEARKVQKGMLLEHGTTLKGLMANHSIDPQHYLDSVHDIDFSPIQRDQSLRTALESLNGRRIVFTNADKHYAEQVMDRLGVSDLFEDIFDIYRADLAPKPDPKIYDTFLSEFDADPTRAIMFEDMARNLIPAHARGMATVWINTGSQWGAADHDNEVIHAETHSLSEWLHHFLKHKAQNE
jgi:putative hydrolase of the HAD superfamily